jgi:hypothetical protein
MKDRIHLQGKMKNLRLAVLGFFILNLFNCAFFNENKGQTGSIVISVVFPAKGYSVKTIPANTDKILVRIKGKGLPENSPIAFDLTRTDTRSVIGEVPEGEKSVKAVAIDKYGDIVAIAESKVNIIPLLNNQVTLDLKPVNLVPVTDGSAAPSCSPQPLPTPVFTEKPCIITISRENLPYFHAGTLENAIRNSGCRIELPGETPVPSQTPSVPVPSPTGTILGHGGNSGSSSGSNNGAGVNAGLNVIDGPPIDIISVTTPGP